MLRVKSSPLGLYYTSYEAFVSIAPYTNFKDALRLFPLGDRITASFKGGHNNNRWNGVMQECLRFAKFIKTYRNSSPEQLKDYEIVEELKFLWPHTKNEIIIDRNFHDNGKKAKITIKTGATNIAGGAYFACENDIKELIVKMASELGINEAQKKCEYWSAFADAT